MLLVFLGIVILLGLETRDASAQSRTRIWDVKFGQPVTALPLEEFVDPACGTNGGPPSLPLKGFEDYARCPVEEETGLHEIWFIYDDEWEYVARAQREEAVIKRYSANVFFTQPIITSLLIDEAGLVQGYRVVTDPRAPADVRIEAYIVSAALKTLLGGTTWVCVDLPRGEREEPIALTFVKESCKAISVDGARMSKLETRHLHKAGQDLRVNPRNLDEAVGDFESSARLEMYNFQAVKHLPCCRTPGP